MNAFVEWIDRSRRAILVATGLLLAVCAASLTRLEVEMDLLAQLPSGSAVFRDYREVLRHFGTTDTLVVLVTGPRGEVPAFGERLAERLAGVPGIVSVRSGIDPVALRERWLAPHRWQLLDEKGYDALAERIGSEAIRERVAGLRRALLLPATGGLARAVATDPLGVDELVGESIGRRYGDPLLASPTGQFLSPDGTALVLLVRPERSAFDTVFGSRLVADVRRAERALLAEGWAGKGITVGHTGAMMYAIGDREVLERDLRLYFLIAPLAVLALFHAGLRTLRILPFVTVPLLAATAVTFALSLLFFGRLTMISVAFAGIFYGLGVDSSIYFYATLRKRDLSDAVSLRAALAGTLREIGPANLVASGTTAAAFFVIGFSGFDGVAQLGVLTGVAMLLNVVATFVLLPAMTLWWGSSSVPAREPGPGRAAWLGRALGGRPSLVAAIVVAVAAVSVLGIPRLALDTDLSNLHPAVGEATEVEARLHEAFGEVDASALVTRFAPGREEALERAARVAHVLGDLRAGGVVASWSTVTAFLPPPSVVERRLARWRALPRGEIAETLREALEAEGFEPAAFGEFFRSLREAPPPLDPDDPVVRPLVERHLQTGPDGTWVATPLRAQAPLAEVSAHLRSAIAGDDLRFLGQSLVEREFHALLEDEVAGFLAAAVVLNLLFLAGFARRAGRVLRLFFPAAAALAATLGAMGLAGVALDPINVVALPVILGLGVDGTVYLAAHARRGVERGVGPLILASGTTFLGFGLLALSRFPALSTLGAVAATGLALATLFTLVFVPDREGA